MSNKEHWWCKKCKKVATIIKIISFELVLFVDDVPDHSRYKVF